MSTRKSSSDTSRGVHPTLKEIVAAAKRSDWHYERTCIALGWKARTASLRRIIESHGYTWGILAHTHGSRTAMETAPERATLGPNTPEELAKYAERFNWNQTHVAQHFDMISDTNRSPFLRRVQRWGYDDWTDFCEAHGKTRKRLTLAAIMEAAEANEWNANKTAQALGYENQGGVVGWLQRKGHGTWSELKAKHAPPELLMRSQKGSELSIERILEAAQEVGWSSQKIAQHLEYSSRRGITAWLERRGMKWADFVHQYAPPGTQVRHTRHENPLTLEELRETAKAVNYDKDKLAQALGYSTFMSIRNWLHRQGMSWPEFKATYREGETTGPKTYANPIAQVAAKNGWQIDLTVWALDTTRAELLAEIKHQGYSDWMDFYTAMQDAPQVVTERKEEPEEEEIAEQYILPGNSGNLF